MGIISSSLRKNYGIAGHSPVQDQVELSSLANSTVAEAERNNNSASSRVDTSESAPRNVQSENTNEETNICRIFKVQDVNTDEVVVRSFDPKILSIGPYHLGSSLGLEEMELVKLECRHYILGSNSVNDYVRHGIMRLEKDARSFYSEDIAMEPNEFAEMLLLDGCFILAYLTKREGRASETVPSFTAMSSQGTTTSDTTGHRGGGQWQCYPNQHDRLRRQDIAHDLLLLENQIPFFVIEKINELAPPIRETRESLKEKIAKYVEDVLQQYPKAIRSSQIRSKGFHHLLHLCHMFFEPNQNPVEHHRNQEMNQSLSHFCRSNPVMNRFLSCFRNRDRARHHIVKQWHRAVHYREAGVTFILKDSSTAYSLLDVTFSNGTMEIPHLSIDANTESIFSNLIVFEHRCPHVGKYINAYVTFMSHLLGTAGDVELLVQKGIIDVMGSRYEQVSNLFSRLNGLADFEPHREDYYLKSMQQSVEAHYLRRPNWWMAWLKHNHLTNPCVAIAALLGFLALLCTIIQQLLSILAHFKVVH